MSASKAESKVASILDMPTLYVRNVPEDLYAALAGRAEERGSSISAETIRLLRRALNLEHPDQVALAEAIRERRVHLGPDGPDPIELLRADRDR